MAKILAIDDDKDILTLIRNILQRDHHLVSIEDQAESLTIDKVQGYDLILLDVMMPNMDGFTFCKKIRSFVDCPILFLTAKSEEEDIVQGLMNGGDDYITKPFGVQVLSARVNAHLRREHRDRTGSKQTISGFTFDFDSKEVWFAEEKLLLTKNEYKICEFLARHKGRVFTREEIYDEVYGLDGNALHSTITEFIRAIRKKCKACNEIPIKTVWGVGYKWE
ncbi:response regulator transcription factor [Paenibacillus sp. PsM32]|uniref:Response regulator transcription factor n=1 Tax=Paenibacillus kyungheensis TaxID=1452732 RepID=A0AAX3M1P6_9BACL|nr:MULTISPECIES: response regulator transcription factor [Paenibacillus]MDN4619150.1 response regulator transcription factor [Paenibacillus sp. PsM32]WCT56184.1 response regulator transcription factor [Paenibacillus kyungheensis]